MLLIVFVVALIGGIGAFWGARKRVQLRRGLEKSVAEVHHQWVEGMAKKPFEQRLAFATMELELQGWSGFGGDILKAQTDAELLEGIESVRNRLSVVENTARWFGRSNLRSQLHAFNSIGGLGDIAASIRRSEALNGALETSARPLKPSEDAWAPPSTS